MFKCLEDAEYVWIVYFVPEKLADKIDAIYASMHFERCFLPDEYEGTPMEAEHVLDDRIKALEAEKQEVEGKILQTLDENKKELAAAVPDWSASPSTLMCVKWQPAPSMEIILSTFSAAG